MIGAAVLPKVFKISFKIIFLVAVLCGLYATCVEPFRLVVTEWPIASKKWPYEEPLKIALIADTHAIWPSMTESHIDDIVAATNDLKPDLVLLLGDYVATHPFGIQIAPADGVRPYTKLVAPCGVFAVLGNHDLQEGGPAGWPQALVATGIPVLRNAVVKVTCHGNDFWVGGLDETYWGRPNPDKVIREAKGDIPLIEMFHSPDPFAMATDRAALTVAGHTHGGQILMPFYGPLAAVVPSIYGNRYVRGHINENGKDLVVSSGLGMTGLPMRFLQPPEITVVMLSQKNGDKL